MKVVILAGGFGTRILEHTKSVPKPMVEIGEKPILWHIMKYYSSYGYNDFVICLGYKGYVIKDYFYNYLIHNSDICIDTENNSFQILNKCEESWKITLVETGLHTMTGGRIRRIMPYVDGPFLLTYGDGLSNVDIEKLVEFHRSEKKTLTMTSILLEGRFGYLKLDNSKVVSFNEKGKSHGNWINGGFFVCEPEIFSYIESDQTIFEKDPMEKLVSNGEVSAFKHEGFWKCMDTLKDHQEFQNMWKKNPEWKNW